MAWPSRPPLWVWSLWVWSLKTQQNVGPLGGPLIFMANYYLEITLLKLQGEIPVPFIELIQNTLLIQASDINVAQCECQLSSYQLYCGSMTTPRS